ncbi:SGNH/GDSL hydrolase family protein [Nonlabens dokdonensis]|uniref:SGNH/GDSL hydrolase family protein n=1 Tax=Nonlabens dokdonensis TaxID=328515 RepID=UPI0011D1EB0D|nr:SGNH/GDSL hydrolase family protein [Nonlabens dokdonensis]
MGISKQKILWVLYIIILLPICLEISLRILNAKPYVQQDYHISSTPEEPFIADDSLGIVLKTGTYDITLNHKLTFTSTHQENQTRRVAFKEERQIDSEKIAVLGCSFTYGYGVNDEEHFTSLLQKRHPNFDFVNYGVIGYGTTHGYLQLKKWDENNEVPKMVILNFATDHFNRNVLSSSYRRALSIGFNRSLGNTNQLMNDARYPVTLNSKLEISHVKWNEMYEDWMGRSVFSSINFIQTKSDEINDLANQPVEITYSLIKEMKTICDKNNAKFIVSFLDENEQSKTLKERLTNLGITMVDVDFDFQNKKMINYPYDNHPNALGHKMIADKIDERLELIVINE